MTISVANSYQNISWDTMTNFSSFLSNANQSASGLLFTGIDIIIFLVLLLSIVGQGFTWEVGLMVSGFICMILSVLFVYMGVMSMMIAGFFVGAIIVMIMFIVWSGRNSG